MLEMFQVGCFVIGCPALPAAIQNADPFEGETANGDLMGFAFLPLLLIVGLGPERSGDRQGGPLDKGLTQEAGAAPAPVYPARVPTAFGDRGDPGVALDPVG